MQNAKKNLQTLLYKLIESCMSLNGHVMVSVILDDDGPLGEPWCEIKGLPEIGSSRAGLAEVLEEDLNQFMMHLLDMLLTQAVSIHLLFRVHDMYLVATRQSVYLTNSISW